MAIGDLKTEKGLKELDRFLADRSYIEGWVSSLPFILSFQYTCSTCRHVETTTTYSSSASSDSMDHPNQSSKILSTRVFYSDTCHLTSPTFFYLTVKTSITPNYYLSDPYFTAIVNRILLPASK